MCALTLTLASLPAIASADALRVTTDEAGAWPAAVAAMQGDLHSEGRSLHVRVYDDRSEELTCSEYSLVLDDVSSGAFVLGACDPRSGATEVRLVHRAQLFEPDDVAPRPRLAGISAVEVRTGGARGGARRTGASEVACSVAVRPYIEDLQNGRHVFLTPGRFVLRPLGTAVMVEPGTDGWVLRGQSSGAVTVEYDVLDTRTQEVVVHTRATLACARDESNSSESIPAQPSDEPRVDPTCAEVPALATNAETFGTTRSGSTSPAYAIQVDRQVYLHVRTEGDFVGVANVYRGCSAMRDREAVLRIAPGRQLEQSITLPPGTYSLVIEDDDGHPHRGTFALDVRLDAHDPEPNLH